MGGVVKGDMGLLGPAWGKVTCRQIILSVPYLSRVWGVSTVTGVECRV